MGVPGPSFSWAVTPPLVLHGLRNCTSASQPSQNARKLWSCVTCAITQHADKSVRSTWLTMVPGRALKRRWNFLVLVDVDAVDCPGCATGALRASRTWWAQRKLPRLDNPNTSL